MKGILFRPFNDQGVLFESDIADDSIGAVEGNRCRGAIFDI